MSARPLILVLGCPRSGTSTVARLLHTKFGVCMGHDFYTTEFNKQGYFEDKAMFDAADDLRTGGITPEFFRDCLETSHKEAKCSADILGFKYPTLSLLSSGVLDLLNPSKIIKTNRLPEEAVVTSFAKYATGRELWGDRLNQLSELDKLEFILEESKSFYNMYMAALAGIDGYQINIGPEITSDEDIIKQLAAVDIG